MGELLLEKMKISESFFGKNHGKLAHLKNLAPKIIYAPNVTMGKMSCLLNPLACQVSGNFQVWHYKRALHKHDPYLGTVTLISRENRHECIT